MESGYFADSLPVLRLPGNCLKGSDPTNWKASKPPAVSGPNRGCRLLSLANCVDGGSGDLSPAQFFPAAELGAGAKIRAE
jgi:hypothetical protein